MARQCHIRGRNGPRGLAAQIPPPDRIDLLTSLTGVSFDAAWSDAVAAELDGRPVKMLSRERLILNKRALNRPKDLAALEWLEQE